LDKRDSTALASRLHRPCMTAFGQAKESAMRNLSGALILAAIAATGCGGGPVVAAAAAERRTDAGAPPAPAASMLSMAANETTAALRTLTLPAGTRLTLRLGTGVSSRSSRIEEPVQATLARAIVLNGTTVVPAGSPVTGYVTQAERSGRVKGRARIGVRFNALRVDGTRYRVQTAAITRVAPGTKKDDAVKIGIGAGAGAIVGAITGGKKGAAIGSAVGGGGGTGVVLATRGKEVALARGTTVTTRLTAPLTIELR
jgi:hypothetical protein